MKSRCGQKVISAFLFLFAAFLIIITGVSMAKPQHNLIPGRIAIYTAIWIGIMIGIRVFFLWIEKKWDGVNQTICKLFFCIFLLVFSVLLFMAGCIARSFPHTDYGNVYEAAYNLSAGLSLNNWDYFSRCPNNRGVMIFLAGLLKFGNMLGMKDSYYFVLGVQVFHVDLVLFCVYYLAGQGEKHRMANAWTAILLFIMLTPLYGNIAIFYSDQCSFGFGIIAFTIYYIAVQKYCFPGKSTLFCLLAGIIWGIGIQIKVTIGVALIALLLTIVIKGNIIKQLRHIVVMLLGVVGISLIISAYMKTLPCEKAIEKDSDPILYWVALGLEGNGSYGENEDFALLCRQAENVSARREIAVQKIKNKWRNFFDLDHLVKKIRTNFACGDLGASGYMTFPYYEGNIIYQFIGYEGSYFWKYACLSTSYLFALFIFVVTGALFSAVHRQIDEIQIISCMALYGIMLFLMLWEAQNKQLFNHAAWLVLAAGCGLQVIQER